MKYLCRLFGKFLFLVLIFTALNSCRYGDLEGPPLVVSPSPATTAVPAMGGELAVTKDLSFVVIATDAPNPPFADIDPFGNVTGFDAELMSSIATSAGFRYEFVVTPYDGILESLANRSERDIDGVMSGLVIPKEAINGIAYTEPYLEVGQVLVVRANERELQSYHDIQPGVPIGVARFSSGEVAALTVVEVAPPELFTYDTVAQALQALIDGAVNGVIIDSYDAVHFTSTYPQQLKIAGGQGQEAWISSKAYGIAVADDNSALLEMLNGAIAEARSTGAIEQATRAQLVTRETIVAGESLVGTPTDEMVIGITGRLADMDPGIRDIDLVSWEVKMNTMSGLLMVDTDNNLLPVLATDLPVISEDKREYTFTLRPGLTFADGREFTAEDVRWSIIRAAALGNRLVNDVLKNSDGDAIADTDSVQVIDPLTVKFVLERPVAYFPYLVATPPYFIISQDCYPAHADPGSVCGGIGPYNIVQWQPDEHMRLTANPQWPGPRPLFENVQLRFYDDAGRMRRSLENDAIDIAWTGLRLQEILELREAPDLLYWQGPAAFKSYLVFEQSQAPWDDVRVRQAAALAIDREALVAEIFEGTRRPLYSPVPDSVLGHVASEPARSLEQARALLRAAGYSPAQPLSVTIWYLNDGRYTSLEEEYVQAIKAQLEETEIFQVTVQGAPYDVFRPQSLTCNYPAYLLGWPSVGQPPEHADPMSWIQYFVTNTNRICSNYESEVMAELLEAVLAEIDNDARLELYAAIQVLWAEEFPTLDITQEPRVAISLNNVENVDTSIDTMGILRYSRLSKGVESGEN